MERGTITKIHEPIAMRSAPDGWVEVLGSFEGVTADGGSVFVNTDGYGVCMRIGPLPGVSAEQRCADPKQIQIIGYTVDDLVALSA